MNIRDLADHASIEGAVEIRTSYDNDTRVSTLHESAYGLKEDAGPCLDGEIAYIYAEIVDGTPTIVFEIE